VSDQSEAELLELLVEDARRKSERERIPDDWEETLAKVRAEHVERRGRAVGPRNNGASRPAVRVGGFVHRRLLDQLRFDGLDGLDL